MTEPASMSRRRLLRALPLGVLAVGCGDTDSGFLGLMDRVNGRIEQRLFRPSVLAPQLPPGSETPDDQFPAYKIGSAFPVASASWRLSVGGLVERPRVFSLEDLMRLPRTDIRVRHHCVEGWSAVASWHGVKLRELASVVGASPKARSVEFHSFETDADDASEHYWSAWDGESAMHPQTLIAYGRNGSPLPPAYGGPARLYGAVKLGYKNVKWLDRLIFTPESRGGYWESRGYEWFAGV